MKTYAPTPGDIERRWYVVDAQDAVLGRLASEVAAILRGKHKPIFAPNADTGDHVVVVNASAIRLTGGKEDKKVAYHHSGYPGGLRETSYRRLLEQRPSFAVEKAVKGMLPKNRLGRQMIKKLHVHDGAEHTHAAQGPELLKLGELPPWTGLPTPPLVVEKPAAKKKAPAAKPSTAKKTTAKKPTAKKPAAKKTTAKKTTAKKTTAKKTTAKKTTAKKTTAKKATAKKTTAKKTTARKKSDG